MLTSIQILKMSSDYNKSDPQSDPQSNVSNELNENGILMYCMTERSATEISNFHGIKDKSYFRKKYIMPLVESNLLEMTIPDKPNSRLQKYKTTNLGVQFIKSEK